MRNRPKETLSGEFSPINLDPSFPVHGPLNVRRSNKPEIPAHVHECFEIGYCHEGHGVFMVEDKIFPCKAGDAFVVNNRELHLLVSPPGMISRWTFLNLDPAGLMAGYAPSTEDVFEAESLSGPEFKNVISSENFPYICNIISRIAEEMTEKKKSYRSAVRALVWELMVMLHRIAPLKPFPSDSAKYKNIERIKPALKYIASNYSSLIKIPKLASISNCSITNFRRIFKSAMGISPQEYLLSFRMEIAKTLLRSTILSILEISLKSGYPTLSNFNRHFKTINGISPREWRKRKKNVEKQNII